VDIGSSFLPSEVIAAYLWAQLENLDIIQSRRVKIWNQYYEGLKEWSSLTKTHLPNIPSYATNNGHMFYLVCKSEKKRSQLIQHLKKKGIHSVFHYLSLHRSDYYRKFNMSLQLPNSDFYTETLLRLPLYYELEDEQIKYIVESVIEFK